MASANTLPLAIDRCLRMGFFREKDPGSGGTLSFANNGNAVFLISTSGAESRALPTASSYGVGTRVLVILEKHGGNLTITGATSSVVLDEAGGTAEFVCVRKISAGVTVYEWRVMATNT